MDFIGERFEIENIGKIKSANIKLNGLTVITGINDTGKSTVGKLLFSIVKGISRYEQDLNEGKEQIILNKIEKLYFKLRRFPDFEKDKILFNEFYPRFFWNQIKKLIGNNQISLFDLFEDKEEELFKYKISLLFGLPQSIKTDCIEALLDIKKTLLQEEPKEEPIKRALKRAFFSEFLSDITSKNTTQNAVISYVAGNTQILDIEIEKNEIAKLSLADDLIFKDVVYIDTPLLLHMYDLIQASDTMFENENGDSARDQRLRPKVSLHIKDLISKIENAKYYSSFFVANSGSEKILKNISTIIKGSFEFDEDNQLIFSQKSGKDKNIQIKPVNTASGIKSFGIIQLLLQANILNDKCLLIVDEPENHLHPEWQVKYAEMIIELVKNDIYVIINSHSPYMIQALRHFSEKEGIQDKVSYYFSEIEDNETQANMKDVTDDLNVIFRTLAKPLNELTWQ